ncbi:MAG: hypothetical protein LKCHEGNO_00667 [Burkholderiaceae bacterium]|nr:hypothetical protein [Burkholderiaceae bacterium]
MKLWACAFGVVSLAAGAPASHAADVGVSVHISQPGVYGRIDIGRFPQPQVVVAQPVVVVPPPVVVAQPVQPVYLWVPYDHRKHWRRYCHQYGACGVPVYFVRHDWYRDHVMVAGHGEHRGKGKRHRRGHDDD